MDPTYCCERHHQEKIDHGSGLHGLSPDAVRQNGMWFASMGLLHGSIRSAFETRSIAMFRAEEPVP